MPPTPTIPVPRVDPGVHRGPLAPVGPGALSSLESFRVDPSKAPASPTPPPANRQHVKNDVKISDKTYGRAEPPPPLGDYDKVDSGEEALPEPPEHIRKAAERENTPADVDSSLDDFFKEHGKGGDDEEEPAASGDEPAAEDSATTASDSPPETPPSDEDIAKELEGFGKGPKPLRKAFEAARKREAKLMQEKIALAAKLKEHETNLQAYQTGAEASEAHKAELAEAKRVAAEREEQIRILDYTKSGEFGERYQKPLEGALARAYADIGKMEITNDDGTTRRATEDDFQTLVRIDNPAKAGEMAERLFGKYGAPEAMSHRRAVQELFRARQEALTNAATESKALLEKRTQESTQHRAQAFSKFAKAKQEILTGKFKDLLGEQDGDEEGNNLLRTNLSRFEKLVSEGASDPEAQIKVAAEMHVMAAKLPVALRDIKKLRAENADLQKQLKAFNKSTPRGGERTTNGAPKVEQSPMEAAFAGIDAIPGRSR